MTRTCPEPAGTDTLPLPAIGGRKPVSGRRGRHRRRPRRLSPRVFLAGLAVIACTGGPSAAGLMLSAIARHCRRPRWLSPRAFLAGLTVIAFTGGSSAAGLMLSAAGGPALAAASVSGLAPPGAVTAATAAPMGIALAHYREEAHVVSRPAPASAPAPAPASAPASAPVVAATFSAPATAGSSTGSSTGMRVLDEAETREGDPYAWGADGPDAFDCSGLVYWAAQQLGITSMPRDTYEMLSTGVAEGLLVQVSDPAPGDLAFFGSGHVEFVTSVPDETFGAQQPGKDVGFNAYDPPYYEPTAYYEIT